MSLQGSKKETDDWRLACRGECSLGGWRPEFSHSSVTMWAKLLHFFKHYNFCDRRDFSISFLSIPTRAQQIVAEPWLIDWSNLFCFSSACMGISSIHVFNTYLSSGYFVSSVVFALGYYDSEQNCVCHSVSCEETTINPIIKVDGI